MPLDGSLEDLNICDLLQLISLSKKSGTLLLQRGRAEGTICFSAGQIVRASSSLFPQGIGQLLLKQGVIGQAQLDQALIHQQTLADHQPLGQILIESYKISPAVIETVIEARIEEIVRDFCGWKQGSFCFYLEKPNIYGSALLNPLDFMVDRGLSTQRLALKGGYALAHGNQPVAEQQLEAELHHRQDQHHQQGVDLLRGMLAELAHPEYSGGIILLILRYASEIMGRGIVFDVRGRQLVGLGQFGLEGLVDSADEIIRKMRLKIDPESIFFRVLSSKKALWGRLTDSLAEEQLRSFLGADPGDVYLVPLISDDKVVALFYGDSYAPRRARALEAFEVFLSQAGLAMDQALYSGRE